MQSNAKKCCNSFLKGVYFKDVEYNCIAATAKSDQMENFKAVSRWDQFEAVAYIYNEKQI